MNDRIEQLIAQMTLEEKISMLAGADNWTTVPVERLGIPAIKVTDGPNGARGASGTMGPSSVCTPVGVALAATWNPDLVQQVGSVLGEETRAKGAHILLAPTVNIHRSPLAGRNFECYSEDPILTGEMATAYINGLQSQGVGACIKHFVCNDSEFERKSMSSEVGERPLHEIYLAPFKTAVRKAKPWTLMSSYNKVNGTWSSENPHLLLGILKGDWGFDGIVISDWFGTYSSDAANGGLDLEMPGPAVWMDEKLVDAVQSGTVDSELIDDKVRRLLLTIGRVGAFENPEPRPERADDKPRHRQLMRKAAGEAIVLLKNDEGILPLNPEGPGSVAIIGANARWAQILGGGSSKVTPHYIVSPLQGIKNRVGDGVQVDYRIGCTNHRTLPLLDANWLRTVGGSRKGFTVEFFDNLDLAGKAVHTTTTDRTQIEWGNFLPPGIKPGEYSARLTGTLTAPETRPYTFGLTSVGLSRLFIDEVKQIDNWSDRSPDPNTLEMSERTVTIELVAGQPYRFVIDYRSKHTMYWVPFLIGCMPTVPADSIDEAVRLAARSDTVILFAGLTNEWESEEFDRPDMELRGDQVELIERVAAVNKRTIVVLNTGSPVTMDWLEQVPAVVQAWYGGQEAGNAIADVLFGDLNPSGKLPTTFPKRLQDNPAYINYPGENGKVHYGEGLFVGYRYYDKKGIEPLFPFGHGLSYTSFAYRDLTIKPMSEGEIGVSVTVENTGACAGQEVVQLYLRDVESSLVRPEKELKAFVKVALEPGAAETVSFSLGQEALSYYDPARKGWVAEVGEYEVLAGSSSRDLRLSGRFTLQSRMEMDDTL